MLLIAFEEGSLRLRRSSKTMDPLDVSVQYLHSTRYGFSTRSRQKTLSVKEAYLLSVRLDVMPIGGTENSV